MLRSQEKEEVVTNCDHLAQLKFSTASILAAPILASFIITALSQSDQGGKPFITVTQNQLAETNYIAYLRQMHGTNLNLP